jgi:hypothetical protein
MRRLFLFLIALPVFMPLAGCGGGNGSSTPPPPVTPQPSVTMSFTPGTVAAGQPATLTWSSSKVTSCAASGSWSDAQLTSGALTFVDVAPGNYSFTLTCTGNYGSAATTASVTVTSATSQVTAPLPGPPAACASNCYYVDAVNGSDQNNGRTPSTAFQTLQMAANTVGPGATVTVMSGTYTAADGGWLTLSTSGTPSAWIRFIAGAGQHPIVQTSSSSWAWYGIQITGSYIVIDGFEVAGHNQSITAAQVGNGDPNSGLFNQACVGLNGGSGAIPHDIVVRNSILHDCGQSGFGVSVGDAITVAYNTVYNNSWWTWYDSSGISLWHLVDVPGSTVTNGYKNFIVGNVAYNNYNNVPSWALNPPGVTDGNAIIIDDNRHTGASSGANDPQNVPYTGRTYIANNIVYSNGGRGIIAGTSAHVDIANNTTYNNMLTDSPYIVVGEINAPNSYDVNVVNNIADNLNGKQVDETDGGTYLNNLWDGSNVPMLGANGLSQDPGFTNAAAGNFTPAAGSPALGSGTAALAPIIDIAGQARPATAIDRGAIQVSQ